MELPISITALCIAWGLVFIGATLQGSLGFGLGTFSVPLLVLVDPVFVPGPTLCLAFFLTVLIYRREKTAVRTQDLKWGIAGRFLGTVAGVLLLRTVPSRYFPLMVGMFVLLAVLFLWSGYRLPLSTKNLISIGSVSGMMGTIASIGGPPMAMLYYEQKGPRIRGTLSGIFIFGTVIAIVGLVFAGRFGRAEIAIAFSLIPPLLLGFYASRFGAAFLDRGYIRPAILAVSGIAAMITIIRHLI